MLPARAQESNGPLARTGFVAGPLLALLVYALLPDAYVDTAGDVVALTQSARAVAAIATWMAIWWMTDCVSIYATALLPLVAFPLTNVATMRETAASYGQEIIFLFLGGFILALGLEKWQLHRRVALLVLATVRPQPRMIVAGFMLVSAVLSMWVTNTATTIMLLPVALSVINMLPEDETGAAADNLVICLLLGIAYAASIGGMGTIIGTAPNVFVASFVQEQLGRDISFAEWMLFAVPFVVVLIPLAWWVLTCWVYPLPTHDIPRARDVIAETRAGLRPMGRPEKLTLCVFILTAITWITRPLLTDIEIVGVRPFAGLTDAGVAMLAAFVLFAIPVNFGRREFLMDWETAVRVPWGILLLLGGGLALAAALTDTGFSQYVGSLSGGFAGWPAVLITMAVVAIVVFLTELTSNTATTATFVPILLAVAIGLDMPPLLLIIPAALAASCAFMLPVATPPNAIVFGSGMLKISQMCRVGFWLNLVAILVISLMSYAILVPVLGIDT